MTHQEIKEKIKENNVKVIRLWFTDILGRLKGFNLGIDELDRALSEGIGFDGSSVEGFVRIEESDLIAKPDPDTFIIFPWEIGGAVSAVMICDILYPDGSPVKSDPRYVLRQTIRKAADMGFDHYYTGPELEYFYFSDDKNPCPLEKGGYFDVLPLDLSSKARKETFLTLGQFGVQVEASHHEVASGQHEIDFRYQDAIRMADIMVIAKVTIKEIARQNNIYATFMPKPIFGINGSGMHVHQSLFRGDQNAFYSPDDKYNLSNVGKSYIAGLLKHSREFTAITNQWINSYKRLVVGYEAPVYISWGRNNRSALVRVPAFKEGKANSCRAELRSPDPGTNPYLCFSVMLNTGLIGIQKNYELPSPVEEDIYTLPEETKKLYGISSLPDSLYAAVEEMENSKLIRDTLGDELFDKYIKNKKAEWEAYRIQVTNFELTNYLPNL
ncbi:glutamine synthetase [bacterium]|nr:glutamine synthetase [bacterium]